MIKNNFRFFDYVDLRILKEFCKIPEGEETTTWKIMRKIFPDGQSSEEKLITRHIKKMTKYGFFICEKEKGCSHYVLIKDNVCLNLFRFPDKIKQGIAIKVNNCWEVIEL